MIPNTIENAIVKFLNSEASVTELEQIESWLEDKNHQQIFKDYVKVNYLIDINTLSFNQTELLKALSQEINKDKTSNLKHRTRRLMRYAAIFIILLVSAWSIYYFNNNTLNRSDQPINEVVLKSDNGSIKVLNQEGKSEIKGRNGEVLFEKVDNQLVYKQQTKSESLEYNTITVPYGRQFSLELSDGTKIQLNAGTSLKFPIQFIEGQNRQVFIEYGEAFFEVAKDPNHPFIVNNNNVDITVLGTQFNVSAYPEDEFVSTVLVEGSVKLYEASQEDRYVLLKPGFKASWSNQQNNFEVSEADIELHTGWRTGKIVLKSLAFAKMVKKLERHYDVVIESKDTTLNQEIVTATFDEESIEEVLRLINEIHPIKYTIEDKKINISKNESL